MKSWGWPLCVAAVAFAVAWAVVTDIKQPPSPCKPSALRVGSSMGIQSIQCEQGGAVSVEGDWMFCRCPANADIRKETP